MPQSLHPNPETTIFPFSWKIWKYAAKKWSWYFVTLPPDDSALIRWIRDKQVVAFGFVRVEAQIGSSTWQTTIFPSKTHDGYLLPVKSDIRKKEHLFEDSEVRGTVTLIK